MYRCAEASAGADDLITVQEADTSPDRIILAAFGYAHSELAELITVWLKPEDAIRLGSRLIRKGRTKRRKTKKTERATA